MAHILLVDDHPALRHALARYLRMFGHVVTDVETAEDALASLGPRRHDIVVTDLNLPRLRGAELVRRLRERGVDAPAILMSGELPRDADAEVAAVVLLKPFGPAELAAAIQRALGTGAGTIEEIGSA